MLAPCGDASHSRKFWNWMGIPRFPPLMAAMAACRSSRFFPVTRTASPWMEACTLSPETLISATIFFWKLSSNS